MVAQHPIGLIVVEPRAHGLKRGGTGYTRSMFPTLFAAGIYIGGGAVVLILIIVLLIILLR